MPTHRFICDIFNKPLVFILKSSTHILYKNYQVSTSCELAEPFCMELKRIDSNCQQ